VVTWIHGYVAAMYCGKYINKINIRYNLGHADAVESVKCKNHSD
jgi:hypothetical protein